MLSTKGIVGIASLEDLKNQTDLIVKEVVSSNDAVLVDDAGVVVISRQAYNKLIGAKKVSTGRRGRPRKNADVTEG
ncbi:MAG TPA: hypothetical protein DIW24_06965 [Bacteroidetes bacterium]|nr:hypothetical protein [Bacteroidota bacterium]HRR08083.1 hypothetical protein [Rhodothermales bacterium]